jgi:hypothetical protein
MKRELLQSLLVLWGITLLCLATLDAADAQGFWMSFVWR